MTITRALVELGLLDKKIDSKIESVTFVAGKKRSENKVNRNTTCEEFKANATSGLQSIKDLIERRKVIKSLIVESNATTKVKIGEKEYTVADAIERKGSIQYEEYLLQTLKNQYRQVNADVNKRNEAVDEKLDELLKVMAGKDSKNIDKESNDLAKNYRETNEYEVVDPIQIEKEIEQLENDIMEFKGEVDFVLSESNAISKIVVPD